MDIGDANEGRKDLYEVVSRNVNKPRVPLGLEQAGSQEGSGAVIRDAGGNVIAEPSDDEILPTVPNDGLSADASFPALDPTWNQIGNPPLRNAKRRMRPRVFRTRRCPRPGIQQ